MHTCILNILGFFKFGRNFIQGKKRLYFLLPDSVKNVRILKNNVLVRTA
jgi:hypothetical protein